MSDNFLVYVLYNDVSNSVYVGKSASGLRRPRQHKALADKSKYFNYPIYKWIRKYQSLGHEYKILVLENQSDHALLCEAEKFYIAYFRSIGMKLLNVTEGGEGFMPIGGKLSPEHKAKILAILTPETRAKYADKIRGRKHSEEHKAKISAALQGPDCKKKRAENRKGRKLSETHKANLSKAGIGRIVTEETRLKISIGNKGKIVTAEQRFNMSAAHKGKALSPEHCQNISDALKGKPKSPEHIKNAGDAQKGKKLSPEHKQKLLEGAKKVTPEQRSAAYWATPVEVREARTAAIISALKGKNLTPEHKAKISLANKGKKNPPITEETRRKQSAAQKGKKLSPESIAKRTATQAENRKKKREAQLAAQATINPNKETL